MTNGLTGFFIGVALMFCVGMIILSDLAPWHTGYCAAACAPSAVVEVTDDTCICGTVDAPVAVRIVRGGK